MLGPLSFRVVDVLAVIVGSVMDKDGDECDELTPVDGTQAEVAS